MAGWKRTLWRTLARRLDRWSAAAWRAAVARPGRPEDDYDSRLAMTLGEWLDYLTRDVVFTRTTWMGVTALKNPLDAWVYQEILHTVRPDVLIEIGSHAGGSTLFFAHLFDLLGHGDVISVDIDRSRYSVQHARITAVTGDAGAPETVAEVASQVRGRRALVVHDGDHSREAVLRDLRLYSRFVTPGSYFIVEDGVVDLLPPSDIYGRLPAGPMKAVEAFLEENRDFEIDPDCERYLLTYNPRGFLKRRG